MYTIILQNIIKRPSNLLICIYFFTYHQEWKCVNSFYVRARIQKKNSDGYVSEVSIISVSRLYISGRFNSH